MATNQIKISKYPQVVVIHYGESDKYTIVKALSKDKAIVIYDEYEYVDDAYQPFEVLEDFRAWYDSLKNVHGQDVVLL